MQWYRDDPPQNHPSIAVIDLALSHLSRGYGPIWPPLCMKFSKFNSDHPAHWVHSRFLSPVFVISLFVLMLYSNQSVIVIIHANGSLVKLLLSLRGYHYRYGEGQMQQISQILLIYHPLNLCSNIYLYAIRCSVINEKVCRQTKLVLFMQLLIVYTMDAIRFISYR